MGQLARVQAREHENLTQMLILRHLASNVYSNYGATITWLEQRKIARYKLSLPTLSPNSTPELVPWNRDNYSLAFHFFFHPRCTFLFNLLV